MKQDFLLKTGVLLVGVIVIVGGFIGVRQYDQILSENEALRDTIKQQENQISILETKSSETNVEYQEDHFNQINQTVNSFIQAFYDIREEGYDRRRKEAEMIVTKGMLDEYFPDNENVELTMEYRVGSVSVYPSVDGENGQAFVVMEGSTVNLNNGQREDNRITLEVFLQKEGEDWVVNKFQQINAEPL